MWTVAEHARYMTFAGRDLGKHDVARFENSLDTIARLDLLSPSHRNEILPTRRRETLDNRSRWNAAKPP